MCLLKSMELYILCLLISALFLKNEYAYGRKCTLKRHPDISYTCEPWVPSEYRTVFQKGKRKDRKGRKGPPGVAGAKGEDGEAGPRGTPGPIGPAGVPGSRGLTGPKGPPGEKGGTGPMGGQGSPGIPGNCIMKNNLAIGGKYHCLAGPMGSQGIKGSKGEQGYTGLKGDKGHSGVRGIAGPLGRRGAVGRPGLPGSPGIIKCSTHRTEWVGRRFHHMDDKSYDGFFCPTGQFLQGFKLEKEGIKQRYNFVCCKLR